MLGKGSQAQVFMANHLPGKRGSTDRLHSHQVAIKIYSKQKMITDQGLKQNLKREIRILRKLSRLDTDSNDGCPYILKIYESIETLDKIFLVMELLRG